MKIVYYFDVLSPYACLCWHVLMRYKKVWNFDLQLKPVFLGGIMAGTGNQPPAMVAPRGNFLSLDLGRSKKFYGIPDMCDMPSNFFSELARSALSVQRLLYAACSQKEKYGIKSEEELHELITAFTRGIHFPEGRTGDEVKVDDGWMEKRIETAQGNCKPKAVGSGSGSSWDVSKLLADVKDKSVKSGLSAQTKEAIDLGAYGVPTLMIDNEFFFGSDRFEQIAFVKGLKWLGPVPDRVDGQALAKL